jgi:hypothetical protein
MPVDRGPLQVGVFADAAHEVIARLVSRSRSSERERGRTMGGTGLTLARWRDGLFHLVGGACCSACFVASIASDGVEAGGDVDVREACGEARRA